MPGPRAIGTSDRLRGPWLAQLIGRAMAAYARLIAATCRTGSSSVTQDAEVLAFWHEYNLVAAIAALRLRRHRHHVSFSTQTFRGSVMNAFLSALDAGSVALPEERDRAGATRLTLEMAQLGREGASVVISPDGPVGPYRRAKPGALIVARESGLPIRPWAVSVRPALRLSNRWDRHIVPLPFCRLVVEEGEPIVVAPREPLRPLLARLQAALEETAAQADRR